MAWTYWFIGGTLVSFGAAFATYVNTDNNSDVKAIAMLLLALGAMFGMSSCIFSQHVF